jgi:CRP-like cAMP-binding protein
LNRPDLWSRLSFVRRRPERPPKAESSSDLACDRMRSREPDRPPDPPTDHDSVSVTRDLPGTFSTLAGALQPFGSLNDEILALLQRNMTLQRFEPGDLLMKQGDRGTSLMIVEEGSVEVTVEEGANRHLLKRAHVGEILGEMALLTKEPRMATVTALTPVVARVLSAELFDELAASNPRISTLLTLLLASRLGTAQHDAMTGNTFHGYRIVRCAGHGGMSVVYEAEDTMANRRVALKMMSHRLLYDPAAMEHFKREADIVESFDHPNIARMYGRFEAFRTSFIVMEFCEGISISDAMKNGGPLPEPLVRKVFGQFALAVSHAHGAGVVHRDIKPDNIMVTLDGTVKLIDFGLAGQLDRESLAPALFGTPNYMAPEQMSGGPIGVAIDLFAMGHVALEMLTGRRLFTGRTFSSLKAEMRRYETPDLMTTLPEITAEFRQVLQSLLQRDPAERRLDVGQVGSWAGPVRDARFASA